MIKRKLEQIKTTTFHKLNQMLGKADYGKFVVVTRSRTGSTLLITLLNSHKEIIAYGEKFRRLGDKSCQDIYEEVFPKKSRKYIGFKIFFYHPLDSEDRSVWEMLEKDKSIKIIHLRRENQLRVHISRLIAGKTEKWLNSGGEKTSIGERKVEIDMKELYQDFEITNSSIAEAKQRFKDHKSMDLSYEELVADKEQALKRVLDFLGLDEMKLESQLKRQNPEKIRDLVTNYDELVQALTGTEHAFMLEE
ncbi:MAG: sulfotransferase [Bacteroidota bacterium]